MTTIAVKSVRFVIENKKMRPIPKSLREKIKSDPFYDHCCLRHLGTCSDEGVQWHHHLIYAGQQVSEKFCILPLCPYHHEHINMPKLQYHADMIMLERASEEQKDTYELHQLEDKLENKDTPWDERQ